MNPSVAAPAENVMDLASLRFADAVSLSRSLRSIATGLGTQQQAAQCLVEFLHASFRDPSTNAPQTALVRCFQTQPYRILPETLRSVARAALKSAEPTPHLRCLTLLGTAGELPAWKDPALSSGHQAIPLPDLAMVERAPMIAGLLRQMGVSVERMISLPAESFLLDVGQTSFNVFHVQYAEGSELIPAQQTFVVPHGIRSVVGMGGLMPSGELFAVILFAKVRVSREVAELFRTLALNVKLAFLPYGPSQVFPEPAP